MGERQLRASVAQQRRARAAAAANPPASSPPTMTANLLQLVLAPTFYCFAAVAALLQLSVVLNVLSHVATLVRRVFLCVGGCIAVLSSCGGRRSPPVRPHRFFKALCASPQR